jgi:hypothetical protein
VITIVKYLRSPGTAVEALTAMSFRHPSCVRRRTHYFSLSRQISRRAVRIQTISPELRPQKRKRAAIRRPPPDITAHPRSSCRCRGLRPSEANSRHPLAFACLYSGWVTAVARFSASLIPCRTRKPKPESRNPKAETRKPKPVHRCAHRACETLRQTFPVKSA